jgi:hypothetical protein
MLIDKWCSFSFERLLKAISVQSTITAPYDYIIYEFHTVYLNQRKQRSLVVQRLWYGWVTNQTEFDPRQKQNLRSSPPFPDRHWGPTSPLFNGCQRTFSHLYLRNCGRKEWVELNHPSPIHIVGVVLIEGRAFLNLLPNQLFWYMDIIKA